MKKLPMLVYLAALAAGLAAIFLFGQQLPARVATHFDAAGNPNGWMTRELAIQSFAAFAVVFSIFIPALLFSLRYLPGRLLNVPRKEHWSQPENYGRACAFLFQSSFWVAALSTGFVCGCFVLLVMANRNSPPALNSAALWSLAALYLSSLAIWIIRLTRYFSVATQEPETRG